MNWARIRTALRLTVMIALLILIVGPEWPAFGDDDYRLQTVVGHGDRFDFVTWELEALGRKARAILAGTSRNMPEDVRREVVLTYLARIADEQNLEAAIERAYADPSMADPEAYTAEMRAQRDALRREMALRQPFAEAIVQQQVATILAEQGLALGGVTWPPVMMTMTPVPYLLVVSPRDRIAQVDSVALVPGLTTEDKEALEDDVLNQLDQSALVVPIGGLGTYPAMIRETGSIKRLAEVTAHEWTHHWLSFQPLGVRYLADPSMRTMNETVATMVDLEIGPLVIERFYPEFMPPKATVAPEPPPSAEPPGPTFDFSAEMAETRRRVDELLAAGQVGEAETYMEERRRFFVEHGYAIRKLNQAYFAFYGGYAAEPGAAGADPIGPMLRELRDVSPSLKLFLQDVGRVTSFDELVTLYAERTSVVGVETEPARK